MKTYSFTKNPNDIKLLESKLSNNSFHTISEIGKALENIGICENIIEGEEMASQIIETPYILNNHEILTFKRSKENKSHILIEYSFYKN